MRSSFSRQVGTYDNWHSRHGEGGAYAPGNPAVERRAVRYALDAGRAAIGAVRCRLLRASSAEISVSTPPSASDAPGK